MTVGEKKCSVFYPVLTFYSTFNFLGPNETRLSDFYESKNTCLLKIQK